MDKTEKLADFARLVYLYSVGRDATRVHTHEFLDSDDEKRTEILDAVKAIKENIDGMEISEYLPKKILEIRDSIGIFLTLDPDDITAILETAEKIMAREDTVDACHSMDTFTIPYASRLMDEIFNTSKLSWSSWYNSPGLNECFENISRLEYDDFKNSVTYRKLANEKYQFLLTQQSKE